MPGAVSRRDWRVGFSGWSKRAAAETSPVGAEAFVIEDEDEEEEEQQRQQQQQQQLGAGSSEGGGIGASIDVDLGTYGAL